MSPKTRRDGNRIVVEKPEADKHREKAEESEQEMNKKSMPPWAQAVYERQREILARLDEIEEVMSDG